MPSRVYEHGGRRLARLAAAWANVTSVAEDPSGTEDPSTQELRAKQLVREHKERRLAEDAPEEEETAQHARRADKARYLKEKLEERAESEGDAAD
jgi:hypothetical protein